VAPVISVVLGTISIYVHGKEAEPFVAEVKARKNGNGFTTLETCSPTVIVCF